MWERISYLSVIAGLIALISIALPWWSASSSSASMSISPLTLGQLSNGAVIGSIGIDPLGNAVYVVPVTVTIGSILGFIGVRYKIACVPGILAILAGFITFASSMSIGLARDPGPEFGLYGSVSVLGVYTSWGLSWGFYLAFLSCLLLAASLKWKRLEMPFLKT